MRRGREGEASAQTASGLAPLVVFVVVSLLLPAWRRVVGRGAHLSHLLDDLRAEVLGGDLLVDGHHLATHDDGARARIDDAEDVIEHRLVDLDDEVGGRFFFDDDEAPVAKLRVLLELVFEILRIDVPARPDVDFARGAHKIYVRPGRHVDAKYLEYKLQKHAEFNNWELSIVEDERAADLVIKIDKTMLNYIFSVVDPETSVVVVTGKVVAINKQVAAEYLGTEIIKKMREVRASSDERPARKKKKAADDDEWSES